MDADNAVLLPAHTILCADPCSWYACMLTPDGILACMPHAVLQDMPGWGDEIDLVSNLKTVVSFLLEQRKKDLLDNKAGVTGETNCCCNSI